MVHKNEIRCRNFNDDGEPINRGCMRGTNCPFVHPNDSAWAQTSRQSDANSNRSGPSHLPGNAGRSSWGGPPTKPASKDWDTSLWSLPSKKTDDNSRKWDSQSSARKDTTAASPTLSVSNDWNMSSDKGETSKSGTEGGWGGNDPTGGWGVDTSVGWGGSGGGGWDGGANEGSASVSEGWGGGKSVDNANTVPSDQKGKSKERQREDVEMRDPSPSRTVGSFKSSSHKQEPAPPVRNTPPLSTVAPKPARPVPLPLPSKQKKTQLFEDGNLKKLAVQSLKNKEAGQVQERQNSLSVRGPKGRADLFSQVIKHTSTVVFLQVELQRAQGDHARWKRTQESAQYERASHATRVILDRHRAELNFRVQEAKRRLDRALTALVDLPDFASRNRKTPGPILTKQTIAAYTAELKDWFSDLELHKRILMEKATAQTNLPSAPVQDAPIESQLTARQLMERGNWSWNDIKTATNELDTRVLTTAEHLYSDVYTTIDDLKDQAVGLRDPRPTISSATTTTTNQSDALSSSASLVGDNLSAQAIRAAELISKIHTLEQEQQYLENEKRAMNKLCAEAEVHFLQFEQWRQDDRTKIQEMTEQLRTLHLRHKSPKASTATLQPAQLDSILLQMRPIVMNHLQKEVQPVFDTLRSRCLENHEGMKNLIEELVKPALVMTDDICHRVSTLSSDETLDSK